MRLQAPGTELSLRRLPHNFKLWPRSFAPQFYPNAFPQFVGLRFHLGKPRHIVSPLFSQVIIQEDRWKQAEIEWGARSEPLDDLPGSLKIFVRVGSRKVEIELVGVCFGEEIATAGERLQVKELVFFETMNGFDVALEGVRGGRDADMLTIAEGFGKVDRLEFTAVVGLPDQIAQADAVAIQVLLDARSENGAGCGASFLGKGPEQQSAANIAGRVLDDR